MCRHLGAGDQEGECWDEMMGSTYRTRKGTQIRQSRSHLI
jgi:hypothetical protein